jgi:hypothetical protein
MYRGFSSTLLQPGYDSIESNKFHFIIESNLFNTSNADIITCMPIIAGGVPQEREAIAEELWRQPHEVPQILTLFL